MMDDTIQDICRFCRIEATADRPLYHPCICSGSIKYVHQDCLVQWLKYSDKEYCEVCTHRYSFIPIYSPDMPKRLPIRDIVSGLFSSLGTAVRYWLHYTLVAFAWLGIVPLSAYRIYKCLFTGSLSSVLSLPMDLLSTENLTSDGFYGCCVVTCTLCAFISLVWLREQIIRGGGPEWLEPQNEANNAVQPINEEQRAPGIGANNNINNNNMGEDAEVDENIDDDLLDNQVEEPNGANPVNDAEIVNANLAPFDNHNGPEAAQDDVNWNPVEWDRAAEELTWERILGLDGSLVFLEHVFWVISLNTLFIVVFAFCPYHIGLFALNKFDLVGYASNSHFEGLVTTLFGYLIIGLSLVLLHAFASIFSLKKTKRVLGLCYVVIKVSLLSVFEIGIFPLVCGWWLDICSLPMLGASLADRENSFRTAPGTSMFIHWLVGMVYVFYFASFILLLREVLRPGVLWFLQNLNDPDFNPIQEMIHLPILGHMRRCLVSLVVFGTTVLLMIWFPVSIVQKFLPGFLPYNIVISNSDSPVSELSLEFLLLQLILPALLDHGHLRQWLKTLIRAWCICASYLLGLRSYLLGDMPSEIQQEEIRVNGLIQRRGDSNNQPYVRPRFFALRLILLLVFTAFSILAGGLLVLTVPVVIGRKLISFWMGEVKVHELNTFACGLYVGLLITRVVTLLCSWIPRGWNAIVSKISEGALITCKTIIAGSILLGLIPLLIGILFDVVIIVPIRVPLNQSPIFYLWQDWAFGVLHTKVICGIAMMGEWRLRELLEEIYHQGLINMNLKFILIKLVLPVVLVLGLVLTIPYAAIVGILPLLGVSFETRNLLLRRIYPSLLFASCIIYLIQWQVNKFCKLYEHIKNDKYLVGKRLVNYDPKKKNKIANSPSLSND
ncbi:E3 ubiquitin-protein ligase MARCH6-like protein [Dinothrombium tinctorium]|uniref:RING-type E3 ubiquitin transferase n=1 Tax=Dinothrombium tinctorium TaxID=1965070 RepID=A0A3S3P2C1_9ACAR|nr:E3 ubiquitin-protein ligase MARCH6-like protein [Dinothrombium tinctorium]RWS10551.1 E3 ubiquitin-protein ligase MARCH6-like protein [Dinothrombium tinctorium]RWS13227.1 E3 ubiquitin-protein ligase MARCH6-like protein [Dinothrombium tinctorium]RWS16692.1 E3 ubiquitin-protein ligase MARCH6-like protein [Dinothrombium tinctorium]